MITKKPQDFCLSLPLISLLMLAAAAVFVYYTVSSPTLGRAIQIGEFTFGAEHWRICYVLYILTMIDFITACRYNVSKGR
jgi:hypothetical protein